MQTLKIVLTQPEQPQQLPTINGLKSYDLSSPKESMLKSYDVVSPKDSVVGSPSNRTPKRNADFCIRMSPRVNVKQLTSPPRFKDTLLNISPPPPDEHEYDTLKPAFRLQKPRSQTRVSAQSRLSINCSSGKLDTETDEADEVIEYAQALSGPLEEEKIMSLDEKPQEACGDEVVEKFYSHYRHLDKIRDINEFKHVNDAMYTAFLRKSQNLGLLPSKIGLIKDRGAENKLKISHYRIGDKYAAMLSEGLKGASGYSKFELSHNRLTPSGADMILSNLPSRPELIDLSGNMIGKIGCEHLCNLLSQRNTKLLEINLEANKLGDYALTNLCEAISDNDTVRKLNLSKNFLTNRAADEIGKMLKNNSSLEELYIRWNQIKGNGGAAIVEGMKENPHLRVLDLSWNSLGLGSPIFANAFADFIARDKKLVHLDLSNNYIGKGDAQIISKALESNHSMYGFHFQGNVGYVDAKGFLIVPEEFASDLTIQTVQPPIESVHIMPDNLKRYHQHKSEFKDVCWICEGWRPVELKWKPNVSGKGNQDPIFIHLSYEGYQGRYLPKSKNFKTMRMVPPVPFSYLFNVDGNPVYAEDHLSKHYTEIEFEISVYDKKKHVKPDFINHAEKSSPTHVLDEEYRPTEEVLSHNIQPRIPDDIYIPPEIRVERGIWKFPISAFKEYKPDTQPMIDKCFEVDFEGTRIAKILKSEEGTATVREMLYNSYRPLKDCYRHFSAIGAPSEIWSIPLNTYTEFCLSSGIIDGKLMKLSDFDRVFIATYTRTDKERNPRNPDRAIVRYQFLEGLVRLADQKYISNALATNIPDAVKLLLDESVKPYIARFDHQKFRVEKYWNEDVDCVIKSYMPIFKGCYKKYSGLRTLPGQKKFMCLEEFNRLLTDMGLFNDNCGERDATLLFNLAMMTQIDELNSDRIYQMQFVEFLEAFARIADKFAAAPFGKTEAEIPYDQRLEQPLHTKIEGCMQRMYEVCGGDIKDIWIMPETSVYELPETKGRVRYNTKKKKLVRVDPTDPISADAYGV